MRPFQIIAVCLLAAAFTAPVTAGEKQTFDYNTDNRRTQDDDNQYTLTMEILSDGQRKFSRHITGDGIDKYENFILNANFDTLEWSTRRKDEETDYTGRKEGRVLTLKGMLKGEKVDKTVELEDDKPFYFSPKFNLQKFVLSGEQEIQFWTLRKDELTPYLMTAKKDGTKVMKILGKDTETVVVKYSPAGKFAKYYRRTYYYRASDGLFVYRKSPMGSVTRLVGPQ